MTAPRRRRPAAHVEATFTIAGTEVTARALAQARQQRAHDGNLAYGIPTWDQLSPHEQTSSILAAANYLHCLTDLVADIEHTGDQGGRS